MLKMRIATTCNIDEFKVIINSSSNKPPLQVVV